MSAKTSPSSPMTTTTNLLTAHTECAMNLVYRKFFDVCRTGPTFVAMAPFVAKALLYGLRVASGGFVGATMILTTILSLSGFFLIKYLAPTKESLEKALEYNQLRLPFWSLLLSCFFSRYIYSQVLEWSWLSSTTQGKNDEVLSSTTFSSSPWHWLSIQVTVNFFSVAIICLRFAIALALLGISVVLRYLSRASIMRCSCVPLSLNSFYAKLIAFKENPFSIAQPGDAPGELLTSPFARVSPGRRFKYPMLDAIASQVILSSVFGLLVASSISPYLPLAFGGDEENNDHDFESIPFMTCPLLVLASFLVSTFYMESHEINPKQYLSLSSPMDCLSLASSRILKNSLLLTVLVPLLTAFVNSFMDTATTGDSSQPSFNVYLFIALFYCLPGSLYLFTIDEAIRASLYNPVVNLEQLANDNILGATRMTQLDVILHSILFDTKLVQEAWKSNQQHYMSSSNPAMEVEHWRNNELCDEISKIMLSRPVSPELMLENDVMRVAILESLGGRRTEMKQSTKQQQKLGSSYIVQEWIDCPFDDYQGLEPPSVSLVRALNGFVGGIGKALVNCMRIQPKTSWVLPDGLLTCSEYATIALTRSVTQSMPRNARPSRNASHISVLIPACLTSLFRLRDGLVRFAGPKLADRRHRNNTSANNKRMQQLVNLCDTAGYEILLTLNLPPAAEPRPSDIPLDTDCYEWTVQLRIRLNEMLYGSKKPIPHVSDLLRLD